MDEFTIGDEVQIINEQCSIYVNPTWIRGEVGLITEVHTFSVTVKLRCGNQFIIRFKGVRKNG